METMKEEKMNKKTFNLTLHWQGEKEKAIARDAGYDLQEVPLAPIVEPGQEGLKAAAEEIAAVLGLAVAEDAAILIGGHTGALVYALRSIKGEQWPEMVAFETRRIRDDNDRFVFEPIGVLSIPPG